MSSAKAPWMLVLAVAAGTGLSALPSCLDRRDQARAEEETQTRCASCHGDTSRSGDALARAAPPRDLSGASDVSYPGVGAHSIHLAASETHAAIACNECHVVPDSVESPGHADDAYPAEISFGTLAKTGGRNPEYDFAGRRCSDSYCHREGYAIWTEPRSSKDACGSCHGIPPPAPHPQSDRCNVCHADVVDAERRILTPGLHVNGQVEVSSSVCNGCHGSTSNDAPPKDTQGSEQISAIGVGAHQAHLSGGAFGRPLECDECHAVPETPLSPGHADALPAEVTLFGVASHGSRVPVWDRSSARCSDSWCHGPGELTKNLSPKWTEPGPLDCASCHGNPPPSPHPQITDCSRCHGEVVEDDDVSIKVRTRHVDGVIDATVPTACTSCHGSGTSPAPPTGAHQTHLLGTPRSRPVTCGECHVVPNVVIAPGHVDTGPPVELVFSGPAVAYGPGASYSAGSCNGTSCHGAVFPDGHASGGTNTSPTWTKVGGTEVACGTCHGLPPPAPHPKAEFNPICSACHENISSNNATFVRPDLHVDGIVTFTVP